MTIGEFVAKEFEKGRPTVKREVIRIIAGEENPVRAAVLALEINSYLSDESRRLFKEMLADRVGGK